MFHPGEKRLLEKFLLWDWLSFGQKNQQWLLVADSRGMAKSILSVPSLTLLVGLCSSASGKFAPRAINRFRRHKNIPVSRAPVGVRRRQLRWEAGALRAWLICCSASTHNNSPSSQQSLAAVQRHPSLSVPGGSCLVSRQDPAPTSLLTAGPVIALTLPGSQHHPKRIMKIPEVRFCSVSRPSAFPRGALPRSNLLDQLLGTAADVPGHLLVLSCPCPSWPLSLP